jgi:hypothetical protein
MSKKSVMMAVFGLLILLAVSSKALAADVTGVWRYEGLPDSEVTIAQDGNLVYISAAVLTSSANDCPSIAL